MTRTQTKKYEHTVPEEHREVVVAELVRFGMSYAEIAEAIGWSGAQVNLDARARGGVAALGVDVPKDAGKRYAQNFLVYVNPETTARRWMRRQAFEVEQHVLAALRRWLKMDALKAAVEELEQFFATLADLSDDDSAAARIWRACFLRELRGEPPSLWREFQQEVAKGKIPPPQSVEEAVTVLRRHAARYTRMYTAPILDQSDRDAIMLCYEQLSERHRQVFGAQHGVSEDELPCEPKTLSQIGEDMGISRERVRQIEREARARLRQDLEKNHRLLPFGQARAHADVLGLAREITGGLMAQQLHEARERIVLLEKQVRELGAQPVQLEYNGVNANLFKRVDDLPEPYAFSVRTINCLGNVGIEYIYQLVERSEVEMLKTKHLSRKGLNEIKEILFELGLSLGIKLSKATLARMPGYVAPRE